MDLGIVFFATSFIQLVRSITKSSASVLKLLSLNLWKSSNETKGPFSPISILGFSFTSSSNTNAFASSFSSWASLIKEVKKSS